MKRVVIRSISRNLIGNIATVEALILQEIATHARVVEHMFIELTGVADDDIATACMEAHNAAA